MTGRRLRVLVHAPHLSGVGHHVRTRAICRALGRRHAVGFFTGGRAVPGDWPDGVTALPLPALGRDATGLVALADEAAVADVLAARRAALAAAVARDRPDVVVIEHWPFSKWDLDAEFLALIAAARAANARVRVVCSVRDLPAQTRHEHCTPDAWQARVAGLLAAHFDALLVHGDEALTPLAAVFPGAHRLQPPPVYTGVVAEPVPASRAPPGLPDGSRYILASVGGGRDDGELLRRCLDAYRLLVGDRATSGLRLVLCQGLVPAALPPLPPGAMVQPFSAGFVGWLAGAALSVSTAGYNTCANLLATGTRALLMPNPVMSDQSLRAELLGRLGVATVVPRDASGNVLAAAISAALAGDRAVHHIDLHGAEQTGHVIEALAG